MLLLLWGYSLQDLKGQTILMPSKASGSYFTRKRFDELLEKERKAAEAKRKKLEKKRALELAKLAAEKRKTADDLIAKLLADSNAAAARLRELPVGSPSPFNFAVDYSGIAQAHHDRMMAQDEDDALSLLLLQ